jgi:hypothetical protein
MLMKFEPQIDIGMLNTKILKPEVLAQNKMAAILKTDKTV